LVPARIRSTGWCGPRSLKILRDEIVTNPVLNS
jgi:hypothetical protein